MSLKNYNTIENSKKLSQKKTTTIFATTLIMLGAGVMGFSDVSETQKEYDFLSSVLSSFEITIFADAQPSTSDYVFQLGPTIQNPSAGINVEMLTSSEIPNDTVHYLAQFYHIPDWIERQELEDQGIKLTGYVGGNTYFASSKILNLDNLEEIPNIRWVGPFKPDTKISQQLKADEIGTWAKVKDGIALTVQFHKDVDVEKAIHLVRSLNGKNMSVVPVIPSITAVFEKDKISEIAMNDMVQFVDSVRPPLQEQNDGARATANVDPLFNSPYWLTGDGITALIYDSGMVNDHEDFGNRIIQTDGSVVSHHATHVAGTFGGDGRNSDGLDSNGNTNPGTPNQWRGMAFEANIRSFGIEGSTDTLYDSGGDLNDDFTTAIDEGIDLATMSLGNNVVRNGFPCGQLGDYTNTAILIDNIVRGSIKNQDLIFFKSAGNERQGIAPCGNFGTISSPATAKNSIAVGAINSNINTMTAFSSFGPTDDGRIKPDIVAPGCQTNLDFGITSTGFTDTNGDGDLDVNEAEQDGYRAICGTSMATPVAAGVGALLIEQWKTMKGENSSPFPHAVKAILIHTATDLGNVGPDYQFGWGALNAQAAADLMLADHNGDLIHTSQADEGHTNIYTIDSDGTDPIQVTLVWDDPPGTALNPNLINNLDLELTDPSGVIYQPFVLDPTNPNNLATRGKDTVNNVEMIVSPNMMEGKWKVSVTGTDIPDGPQPFTLITSEGTKKYCHPYLSPNTYPDFYRHLSGDPDNTDLIAAHILVAAQDFYHIASYLNCLDPVDDQTFSIGELAKPTAICIDFSDHLDLFDENMLIPYKCPPLEPCRDGLSCPDLPYVVFKFETSVFRDLGLFVNGKISQDEFGNRLVNMVDSDQIRISYVPLVQPTNEITSTVQIVRSDIPSLSTCSVNIAKGHANYGEVTLGEIAKTQFVLQTKGNPIVSVVGSEWIDTDGKVVMDSGVTRFELVTAELGEEPQRLQTAYADMERLKTKPTIFGQVNDLQKLDLFLHLKIPTTYDRETLYATQSVVVFAEC